jgi:tRNA dimethylallyltransferase
MEFIPPHSVDNRPPVLCIVGPTASGKSGLAVEVAKVVGGEVLSADSMQIYRGMNIGTAKLSPSEMQGVPHHLMDLVNPDEAFSVAQWTVVADQVIHDLHQRGKLPIVAGGTGLYIRAITEDLHFAEQSKSEPIREKWQAYAIEHGNVALHDALRAKDEVTASRLHPNDVRRVIRALEVVELTHKPLSTDYEWAVKGGRFHAVQYGLTMDRETLYQRVNARVDEMMAAGLNEEVAGLLAHGYSADLTALQAIGYKELIAAARGVVPLSTAVEQIKQNTRRYVKRQMSWFRRDPRIQWLTVDALTGVPQGDFNNLLNVAKSLTAGIRVSQRE